jgi:single-stranded DNA-binding protein
LVEGSLGYSTYEKEGQKLTRAQIRATAIRKLDRTEKTDEQIPETEDDSEEIPF